MSTAALNMYGDESRPERRRPDRDATLRASIRALRSAHRVDADDLARHLGISRKSLYNRLNGAVPWLAAEIPVLADYFGCSIQDLYEGTVHIHPLPSGTTRTPPDGTPAVPPVDHAPSPARRDTRRGIVIPITCVTPPPYPNLAIRAG